MIPSRVLRVSEIIGETFVSSYAIVRKCFVVITGITVLTMFIQITSISDVLESYHQRLISEYSPDSTQIARFRDGLIEEFSRDLISPLLFLPSSVTQNLEMNLSPADTSERVYTDQLFSFLAYNADIFTAYIPHIIVSILLYTLLFTFLTDISIRNYEQRRLRIRDAFIQTIGKNMWKVLAQWLILFAVFALGLSLVVAFAQILPPILEAFLALAMVISVYGMIIRVSISTSVLISEELSPWKSLMRSIALVKNNVWRVLGILIVVGLCVEFSRAILSSILGSIIPTDTSITASFFNGEHTDIAGCIRELKHYFYISSISTTPVSILFAAAYPVLLTTIYYNLRTKKEGPLTYETQETSVPDGA